MGRTIQTCVIRFRGKPDLGYQNLPKKNSLHKVLGKNTTLKSERLAVRLMKCSHRNFPYVTIFADFIQRSNMKFRRVKSVN